MDNRRADVHRLSLLIQRMLDAEMLLDVEGDALLKVTDAVHRSLATGDTEAARRHLEQIMLSTEAIVETNPLALMDGREVIQVADRILNPGTDAGQTPP